MRDAKELMHRLAEVNSKSDIAIEADRTVHAEAEGAVAGENADHDEEFSLPVCKERGGAKVRQRDKSSALKNVTSSYGNKLADILSIFRAWGVFRDSLGIDFMNLYQGIYGENEMGEGPPLSLDPP